MLSSIIFAYAIEIVIARFNSTLPEDKKKRRMQHMPTISPIGLRALQLWPPPWPSKTDIQYLPTYRQRDDSRNKNNPINQMRQLKAKTKDEREKRVTRKQNINRHPTIDIGTRNEVKYSTRIQ